MTKALLTDPVFLETTGLTKVEPKASEEPQLFLKRLHAAVDGLPDDVWDAMSKPAQRWSNACTTALDAKTDLPGRPAGAEAEGSAKKEPKPKKKEKTMATKAKKNGKAAKGKAKGKNGSGRPRIDESATVRWLVKDLPEGNRNEHQAKVPNGTAFAKIRKNKTLLRVVRYWRRNGYIELKSKAA